MFIYSIEHVISIFSFLIIVVMENQQVHHQRPGFIQMRKLFMIMFVHVLILIKIKSFYLVVHLAVLLHCTLVKTKSIMNIQILLCLFFRKASHLAQTNPTSPLYCVILENTFTSISDMAKRLFQVFVLDYVPIWCYKNVVEFRRRCFFSSNIFLIFNIVFINHKNSSYRSTSTFSFR